LKSQIYLGQPHGAGAGIQAEAQVLGAHGLFILHPLSAKTDNAITVPITIFFMVSPFIRFSSLKGAYNLWNKFYPHM